MSNINIDIYAFLFIYLLIIHILYTYPKHKYARITLYTKLIYNKINKQFTNTINKKKLLFDHTINMQLLANNIRLVILIFLQSFN